MFLLKLPLTAKLFLGAIVGSMAAMWVYARGGRASPEYDFLTIENDDGLRDEVHAVYRNGTLQERAQIGEWLRQNGYMEAARHFPI
jgi:hypothetical protein